MKKYALYLAALLLMTAQLATAQNSETRRPGSFDYVSAGEAVEVILVPGDQEKVLVEVRNVDLEDVITEVYGSKLKIEMAKGSFKNADVQVTVTYKSLERISASSAARISTKGELKADELEVDVSSAGKVILDLDVKELDLEVSSAGSAELEGDCEIQSISVSSAGEVDAQDLDSMEASVQASSGGHAKLSVSNQINAQASSGGSIRYYGNPDKENTMSSSGGSIRKG